MTWIIGLACFGIGTVFGIILMCLLQINRISGDEDRECLFLSKNEWSFIHNNLTQMQKNAIIRIIKYIWIINIGGEKMKKGFMALFVVVLVSLSMSVAFGNEIETVKDVTKQHLQEGKAILLNEYGEGYEVDVTYQDRLVSNSMLLENEPVYARTINIDMKNASPLSTTDSNYREKWDSTGSVLATSTIYFKSKNTPTEYLLTKVSVGYTIKESRVRVVGQELVAACTGTLPSVTTQRKTFSPAGTSSTFNTGFTKYVVNSTSALIGATYTITMKAGTSSSTWQLIFSNTL